MKADLWLVAMFLFGVVAWFAVWVVAPIAIISWFVRVIVG